MQSPIVNAGLLYVNGLGLTRTSASVLTVATGAARDSTNVNDITVSSAVTVTKTTSGAGGLDTGTIANSTMYALYVIGDSTGYNDPAAIISTSTTGPLQPFGYDMFRRIGWALTDGSANFLQFWQDGNGQIRNMWYDVGISELAGGSATSFTAIDLATSVPPIATEVMIDIAYTPNGATDVAEFLPFGSSASNGFVRFGCGAAAAQVGQIKVPCRLDSSTPKIQYKVTAGDTITLLVVGYQDYLA